MRRGVMGMVAGAAALACAAFAAAACAPVDEGDDGADSEAWLKGSTNERFAMVEEQLAGFGRTMWEMGYRYSELYWAGEDGNWKYALHQIEELNEVLEHGLIRRPQYAESAKMLPPVLADVAAAAESGDRARFATQFQRLTDTCNACHAAEEHAYVTVRPPLARTSPVRHVPAD